MTELHPLLGKARSLHARTRRLRTANYDISRECNLKCEGCLFFEGETFDRDGPAPTAEAWDERFARDVREGVTLGLFSGAEPALALEILHRASRHFADGVVLTNGTIRIPDSIRFRIHISLWGLEETGSGLRGADSTRKALANYRNDRRAVCIMVISAANIGQIIAATALVKAHGLQITFSYFSPTERYNNRLSGEDSSPSTWFHRASQGDSPVMSADDLAAARAEIREAMRLYPETVLYSLDFDDWVTRPSLYKVDPDSGIAVDCGIRQTGHRSWLPDLTAGTKCCTPHIDCRTCRAYATAYNTWLHRFRPAAKDQEHWKTWLEVRDVWTRLFLLPPAGLPGREPAEDPLSRVKET